MHVIRTLYIYNVGSLINYCFYADSTGEKFDTKSTSGMKKFECESIFSESIKVFKKFSN